MTRTRNPIRATLGLFLGGPRLSHLGSIRAERALRPCAGSLRSFDRLSSRSDGPQRRDPSPYALHPLPCPLWIRLAGAVGVPIGILMGRFRRVERFFLPLVSVLMPIPSLAWVPVFILWFGLGNAATIALVFYAATFPVIFNTWTGVRSVNRLWIRSAEAMGADEKALFQKVVLPAVARVCYHRSSPSVRAGVDRSGRRRNDRGHESWGWVG